MREILVVVDMQNDFVTGVLGSPEAVAIVPHVVLLCESFHEIYFTLDTHGESYPDTREGRHLPILHCQKGTDGHALVDALAPYRTGATVIEKAHFAARALVKHLEKSESLSVTLCGVCTDICVVMNALMLKSAFPEANIAIVASACAGVTPEKHLAALSVMESCQIEIIP